MILLKQLKEDQLTARKGGMKREAELLTTLYSEAVMIGKNDGSRESTDAEVVQTVKKFIKNINETIVSVQLSENQLYDLDRELSLYGRYLPKQLTKDELDVIILEQINANGYSIPKDMGNIMKYLSSTYTGRYDGKTASELVRSYA